MIPSEELELKLYRFAEFAGRARWQPADLGTLATFCQFIEQAVLVDAIHDLHTRKFMEFRQWNYPQNDWILYAGQNREYFSCPFEMRVTFPGRKYFEGLEAQSTRPFQPADGREIQLHGTSEGRLTAEGRLDSSPQAIAEPPPPPKAFVSHSGQDRQFVQKFVADLCDFGVRAWYSRWEIKAGDSIPKN